MTVEGLFKCLLEGGVDCRVSFCTGLLCGGLVDFYYVLGLLIFPRQDHAGVVVQGAIRGLRCGSAA